MKLRVWQFGRWVSYHALEIGMAYLLMMMTVLIASAPFAHACLVTR